MLNFDICGVSAISFWGELTSESEYPMGIIQRPIDQMRWFPGGPGACKEIVTPDFKTWREKTHNRLGVHQDITFPDQFGSF